MEDKQTFITRRNVLIVLLVALVICIAVLAVVVTVHNTNKSISVSETPNCSTSAIIRCGSSSTSELKTAYNKSSYAKNVFAYFSITGSDVNKLNKTAVAGTVNSNGNVYIQGDNLPFANNALIAVRSNKGATGAIDYKGSYFVLESPSQVFTAKSESAFVITKKNTFQYAILASGDNPVIGTNITAGLNKTPSIASNKGSSTSSSTSSSSTNSSSSSTGSSTTGTASSSSTTASSTPTNSSTATTPPKSASGTPLSSTGPSTTISIVLFSLMSTIAALFYRRHLIKRLNS